MILYLDTSALVKLYVQEEGSTRLREGVAAAAAAATSRVAYVEARAALARAYREGGLSQADYHACVAHLDADWESYLILEVTPGLTRTAADLVEAHRLRGFDAIHLSSAVALARSAGEPVGFACWDVRLWEAASTLGFVMLPESSPG